MDHPVISPKKLIEVALPLDAINAACAREKSIRHGHPSTLHLWWARRPLAAARAVIFSQIVNDPEDLWRCQNPGKEPNNQVKGHWTKARAKLFTLIEDLVKWENTTNEGVLERAREEIRKSWRETCDLNKNHPRASELFDPENLPGLHDPFAGGGAIPLEAQRLGLEAYASDLNPVAVLINKAMIEIPPKFANQPPVRPEPNTKKAGKLKFEETWKGAAGLAEDVRYYGQWMRDEAEKRIGHLYPKVEITAEMVKERPDLKPYLGQKLTVIAWLWARTVKSPNPSFSKVDVPLASTFMLSTKAGKEAYVEPVIDGNSYRFTVKVGKPKDLDGAKNGTKLARGANFECLMSGTPIASEHIYGEANAGRMGARLMAIVAEGTRGRVYLAPTSEHEAAARKAKPVWKPEVAMPANPRWFSPPLYGLTTYGDLFTPRQLVALTTFSDLVGEAMQQVRRDALHAGLPDDPKPLRDGGTGATAYAEAVGVYLGCGVSKTTNRANSIALWMPSVQCPGHLFARQAIPMSWDFAEGNTVAGPSGSFDSMVDDTAKSLDYVSLAGSSGHGAQEDAAQQQKSIDKIISTDPPYYDNIGYAELSDFFYVWLRRSLRGTFPDLFATLAVPKAEELVATPYRHGSKENAETFFLDGMTQAMQRLVEQAHPAFPVTIYYAFKQSETQSEAGTSSTGWETFIDAVIRAGFGISGTWPMRTERENRKINQGTNALASSIVLVCRQRGTGAGTISRRQFIRMLNETLPTALNEMTRADEGQHSPVAPVDLSQAIIGPGMAIFSRYEAVLEADGTPMTVKTALQLINRFLAEDDFDADTQFCLHWFEQYGWEKGKFGEADTLARAKGTAVDGVKQAGVIESVSSNVRLLKWKEYPKDWDPNTDTRLPVWEALHQLIMVYNQQGDSGAAKVLAATSNKAEAMRNLVFRLYTLCERKGWAEDARAYNEIGTGWSAIESTAAKLPGSGSTQGSLFDS